MKQIKQGFTVTAAVLGGLAVVGLCALVLYRRYQKEKQTVYPAARGAAGGGAAREGDNSSGEESAESDSDASDA